MSLFFFFFFQAEDGIRDVAVTGVQTCALPISCSAPTLSEEVAIPRLRAIEIHGFPYPLAARRAVILRGLGGGEADDVRRVRRRPRDRKSTRLNSSHGYISYAVFCLKKKKKKQVRQVIARKVTEDLSPH